MIREWFWLLSKGLSMGVGAQYDLGGTKVLPKNDLKIARQINRFICQNWGDL